MDFDGQGWLRKYKWQIAVIVIVVTVVVLLTVFTDLFQSPSAKLIPQLIYLLGFFLFLMFVITVFSKAIKMAGLLADSSGKLDKMVETLEKNRAVLTQINQNTRLSETAKAIAFRDAGRQSLRESVFDKLQQKDYDATYEIIDEIAHVAGYQELAEQLRLEADKYRTATDVERVNQVIAHIEKLLDNHLWAKASARIEGLIAAEPNSEKAKEMRQRLLDRKQQRKKELLTEWDDAVKRRAIDRSLEILRELDLYLTPNEGLALQEAARDVFRTKLHNLGVQFSLAVSEKQWAQALQTGRQIIRDFPNSRMADEIREKVDILSQKVEQQQLG